MAEETGFFRFDTNAGVVANDIQAALSRINASMSQGVGLDTNQLDADARAGSGIIKRFEADVSTSQRRIQQQLGQVASGKMTAQQFAQSFQNELRTGLRDIPRTFASGLAETSSANAARLNATGIGRQVASDYVQTLTGTIENSSPRVRRALEGVQDQLRASAFSGDIERIAARPVGFGSENTRVQQLTNALRLEKAANLQAKQGIDPPPIYAQAVKDYKDQAFSAGQLQNPNTKDQRFTTSVREELAVARREEVAARAELARTQREADVAMRQADAAERRAAVGDRRRPQGFVEGAFSRATSSGADGIGASFGGSVAAAARFSAAYGALFAGQAAVFDTINEVKDYQDSLTDLSVATKDTGAVTKDFVNDLSDLARISGANTGAALDTAARGIRAFGADLEEGPNLSRQQQQIGEATNLAATQLALIANKDLPDATGDLVASGTAFGLGPDQLSQIVDAVANAKRNVGGDVNEISQGLALVAGTAQEAGFSLNEAAAFMGLIQARTDQSGQAIATRVSRIFQIISGSTGKSLAAEFGIDSSAPVKEQIEGFAEVYSTAGEEDRQRITSGLGGTANLRELLPLLKENQLLQRSYESALNNTGQGTDEFNRKSDDLVGTLRRVGGTVRQIQVEVGTSGLFAPLAVGLQVLDPTLNAVNRLLKLYNDMPAPLRGALGVLINIAAVSKTISVLQAKSAIFGGAAGAAGAAAGDGAARKGLFARNIFSRGGGDVAKEIAASGAAAAAATRASTGSRIAAERTYAAAVTASARDRVLSERAFSATVASSAVGTRAAAGAGAGAAAAGGTLLGSAGLRALTGAIFSVGGLITGGILAGLYAFDKVGTGLDQKEAFEERFSRTQAGLGRIDNTPESIKAAVTDLRAAAGEIGKSKSNFISSGTQDDVVTKLEGQADALGRLAEKAAAEQSALAQRASSDVFGPTLSNVGQLADGIASLREEGASAITVVRLFAKTLNEGFTQDTARTYRPDAFTGQLVGNLNEAFQESVPDEIVQELARPMTDGAPLQGPGERGSAQVTNVQQIDREGLIKDLTLDEEQLDEASAAINKRAKELGLLAGSTFSDDDLNELVEAGVGVFNLDELEGNADQVYTAMKNRLRSTLVASIGPETFDPQSILNGETRTREKTRSIINPDPDSGYEGSEAYFNAGLAAVPASDDGRMRNSLLRQRAGFYNALQEKNTGGDIEQLTLLVDNAENDYAEAEIERLETVRRAAQNKKGLSRRARRIIGRGSLQEQVDTAGDNVRLLIEVMERANNDALDEVQAGLDEAAALQRAARFERARALQEQAQAFGGMGARPLGAFVPELSQEETVARAFRRARRQANVADKGGVIDTGSDAANYKAPEKGEEDEKIDRARRRADREAARAAAEAARAGGGVAAARADLAAAEADLNLAKKGSTEYYRALERVYNAQRGVASAEVDLASSKASADAARIGGGLATARAGLIAARGAVQAATAGSAEYYRAMEGLYNAQRAYQEAQATEVAAQASAGAARVGGGIAAARASITAASGQLNIYAQGTAEYFQALEGFYNGQRALRESMIAYKSTLLQLRGDITDPVENARDALRAARLQLAANRRAGQSADVIAEDRLATRQAQTQLEAAKFTQRLSDVQTAEQLGKISHAKYINYLENESRRLNRVKRRSRQQQDQLNEIDLALKDAKEAGGGMFNLGDINTNGLVYQVRRQQAEARAAAASARVGAAQQSTQQNVSISINGADTAKVQQIITRYLGTPTRQNQTLVGRKV